MYHEISFLDVFSVSITRPKAPVSDTPNVSIISQFFYYVINHLAYVQFLGFDKIKPYKPFISGLEADRFDFFFRFSVDLSNQLTFVFTAHSFYKYVQSNQSNTRDRKNVCHKSKLFFLQCSSLFLSANVSCLLNKKSMVSQ